eukprot:gene715-886_t
MIKKLLAFIIAYALTSPVVACKPSKGILSPNKIATILVELELNRTMIQSTYLEETQSSDLDTLLAAHAQRIYQAHATDASSFEKSYSYYAKHPAQLQAIYNQMNGKTMQADGEFSLGDHVQLIHTEQVGEIIAIHQNKATIQFTYMTLTTPLHSLRLCKKSSLPNKPPVKTPPNSSYPTYGFNLQHFIDFDPVLDLHGLPLDDALHVLDQWINQALLSGHRYLRIIHGKGKGILKQKVVAYLRASGIVCTIRDNHHLPGGSGVTIVEIK